MILTEDAWKDPNAVNEKIVMSLSLDMSENKSALSPEVRERPGTFDGSQRYRIQFTDNRLAFENRLKPAATIFLQNLPVVLVIVAESISSEGTPQMKSATFASSRISVLRTLDSHNQSVYTTVLAHNFVRKHKTHNFIRCQCWLEITAASTVKSDQCCSEIRAVLV